MVRRSRCLAAAGAALLAMALGAPPALAQVAIERVEIVPETPGAPGPLQTYSAGQTFAVWFMFSEELPAAVPGVTARIEIGGKDEVAGIDAPTDTVSTGPCRSDGRGLICPYTVTTTDLDPDGVLIPEECIVEARGTVLPVTTCTAQVQGVDEAHRNHRVDGVSPGLVDGDGEANPTLDVTSVPANRRCAYRAGEVVRGSTHFSETVGEVGAFAPELLPGRPMVTVGGAGRTRHFIHVVRPGDNVARVYVAALSQAGDVRDVHGNRGIHRDGRPLRASEVAVQVDTALQDCPVGHAIDTAAPTVVEVRLATTRTLVGSEDVDVTVVFDEPVTVEPVAVDGEPLLRVRVGGAEKRIRLATGVPAEPVRELTFRWPKQDVAEARVDGGLGVPADALVLAAAGASVVDAAGNPSGNTPPGFDTLGVRVDSRPPRVVQLSLPALPEARVGSVLQFAATFDEDVGVDPDEAPSLAFHLGSEPDMRDRVARVLHASARTLTFGYTVKQRDVEAAPEDGTGRRFEVAPGALAVATAVRDRAGNAADDGYAVPATQFISLAADTADTDPPQLLSVTTDRRQYGVGATIVVALRFSEDVRLDSWRNAAFTVAIGGVAVRATLDAPVDGPIVRFRYPVQAGDSGRVSWSPSAFEAGTEGVDDLALNAWSGTSVPAGGGAEVDTRAPAVVRVSIESRPANRHPDGDASDLYYGKGDRIVVNVTASEPVVAGPTAALMLDVGDCGMGCQHAATYRSGSGSVRLTFDYRVGGTDRDVDGISVTGLAGIEDPAGNPVDGLGVHAIHNAGGHPVDGALSPAAQPDPAADDGSGDADPPDDAGDGGADDDEPDEPDDGGDAGTDPAPVKARFVLATGGGGDDGSYLAGESIVLRAEFDAPGVDIATPLTLALDIGGVVREVTCAGLGRARRTAECTYRVRAGDQDLDGVFVTVVSGDLRAGDVEAVPDLTALDPPALLVDARPPTVATMAWSTDPGADETYVAGDEIGVEVLFSEPVTGQGTLSLPLRFGRTTRRAALASPAAGQASARFEFRYTVVSGDEDPDGVAVPALGIGSLVGSVRDAAGHEAVLAQPELADDPAHVVDTRPPSVVAMALVGARTSAYGVGSTVSVALTFDEPVAVGPGGARLALQVGGDRREAIYVSGSGSPRLVFDFEVGANDNGALGVVADGLGVGVSDIGGNPVSGNPALALGAVVDTVAPGIKAAPRLASAPEGGVYGVGDRIEIGVVFSEAVLVTPGTAGPYLRIGIGGVERRAAFDSGSGTEELRFAYAVAPGDRGEGVTVPVDAVSVGDGSIRDPNGIDAVVRHPALAAAPGHRVDGVAPAVTGAAIVSRPRDRAAYLAGEAIVAEVRFGETVLAPSGAVLAVTLGDGSRDADCVVADGGGDTLRCSYTVVLGDFDGDGVAVPGDALAGDVVDGAGNAASLVLEALADDPRHRVHAAPPDVLSGIGSLTLVAGGASDSVDLGAVFGGFRPVFEAASSDEDVVAVVVSGQTLILHSGVEGTATVRVTASNVAGARSTGFEVEVVTDPGEKAALNNALAGIGRGMLAATSGLIGARFDLAREGSSVSLGGRRLVAAAADPRWSARTPGARQGPAASGPEASAPRRVAETWPLGLSGSNFDLRLSGTGGRGVRWSVWGGGDVHAFGADDATGSVDATGTTGVLGVDGRGDSLVAGLAFSMSAARADYAFSGEVDGDGTLETTFIGVHPYARLAVSDDSDVWVIGGFGGGEARARRGRVGSEESTVDLAMAAAGLRRALAFEFGGAAFAFRGDAAFLSIGGEEGRRAVDGLAATVSRLRLGLEGAWQLGSVSPFAALGGRFDGGDGASGGGVELSGGVRIGSPFSAFALEARGRVVAVPFGGAGGDSGVSVAAAFEPGRGGRGFWLRLAPRWGASTLATDPFARGTPRGAAGVRAVAVRHGGGFDAAVGYGLELRSVPGVLTPFAEADRGAGAVLWRTGMRYRGQGRRFVQAEAAFGRRTPVVDGGSPGVTVSVLARW